MISYAHHLLFQEYPHFQGNCENLHDRKRKYEEGSRKEFAEIQSEFHYPRTATLLLPTEKENLGTKNLVDALQTE